MAKMHPDEVNISIRLVRQLLAAQFPQWAGLPIEPVIPLGTDNAIYRLGTEMVVRLPRRERPSQTLEKERLWLPRLAPHLPFAIPIPRAHGTPAEGYPFPWSVYGWLKGGHATINSVTDLNQLATDLARFVTSLQRIDTTGGPSPGPHNFFRGAPLATRDEVPRAAIGSLGKTIDGDVVTAAWDAALRAPEWKGPPTWVHGDLDSRNLLVDRGRLCAVIDFGGSGLMSRDIGSKFLANRHPELDRLPKRMFQEEDFGPPVTLSASDPFRSRRRRTRSDRCPGAVAGRLSSKMAACSTWDR
jgi:aminoglycoside phosphotransferase (APT) family kinase protein